MFFFLSHKIANAPSYFLTNRFHLWIALKKPLFQYICLYLLLIMLMYIVINNKLRQKISILALLKQFKFKINLSRNNLEHLLWLNFERQKEVNIKGICSFVTDFGNFKGEKWSNIVEYSRRKTFLFQLKSSSTAKLIEKIRLALLTVYVSYTGPRKDVSL